MDSYFKTGLYYDPGKQKLREEEGHLIWGTGGKEGKASKEELAE